MADISKVTLPNGSEYNIKDSTTKYKVSLTAQTTIPANSNLNDTKWLKTGSYANPFSVNTSTISNVPSGLNEAFMLNVYSPLAGNSTADVVSGNWIYRVQEITSYGWGKRWARLCSTNGSGVWTYPSWTQIYPDPDKVDKVSGKGLSTNDFTTALKNKLDGIAEKAEVNVQADWNVTDSSSDAYIKNKPTIPMDTDTWKAYYGTCTTAAATAEKAIVVSTDQKFSLKVGAVIGVKFSISNTASSVKLNVNSTGAKSIWYSNAVYTGTSTDITGYANRLNYYMYDGTNWVFMTASNTFNANTYDRTYLSNSGYKAKSAIVAANIIVAGSDGLYFHLKSGAAFDITHPILYANSACAANAVNSGGYIIMPFTVTTTQSISLTAYKPVYIKGKLSGTTFTPVSTAPLTQTIPTSEDGYQYILLGRALNSTTVMYLLPEHPIFEYRGGKFQLYKAEFEVPNLYVDPSTMELIQDGTTSEVTFELLDGYLIY